MLTNITNLFSTQYKPTFALVVRTKKELHEQDKHYVETYDINAQGQPCNAHPLSELEAKYLAKLLTQEQNSDQPFLRCSGLLPTNILAFDQRSTDGFVVWYTSPKRRTIFLTSGPKNEPTELTIQAPPMVWKATKNALLVFALRTTKRPTAKTQLYRAPFGNTSGTGSVCMGSVEVSIPADVSLKQFTDLWESYYFNSKFTHAIGRGHQVEGDLYQIYQTLQDNPKMPFPAHELIASKLTLKTILPR